MVNRSYLYAVTEDPKVGVRSVGECKYALPLLFCILCSANPHRSESLIWDSDAAISADFTQGVRLADAFLEALLKRDVRIGAEPALTGEGQQAFRDFFAPLQGSVAFALECLELYDMSERSVDDLVREDLERIESLRLSVTRFLETGELDAALLEELRQDRAYACGVGYLADILYFDFGVGDESKESEETGPPPSTDEPETRDRRGAALWRELKGWASFALRIAILPPFGIFLGIYALRKRPRGAMTEGIVALLLGIGLSVAYVTLFLHWKMR